VSGSRRVDDGPGTPAPSGRPGLAPAARYVPAVRVLLVVIAAVAIGVLASQLLGGVLDKPVTKAEIERAVAKKPRGGKVQLTLCNEQFVPSQSAEAKPPQTWTCDTYLGPNKADAQNGPSYQVLVRDGDISSIRQVPVH
jgi:hypothetical protein